jgi:O-succinylbenzoate synthase
MTASVRSVDLYRVALPLVHEHRAAHGAEQVRDLVLVRVELDHGSVGWGECSALAHPTYTAEFTAGAWVVLVEELVPALLAGGSPSVVGHPMASAALATALADARLAPTGRSLADDLAGSAGGRGPARAVLARTVVVGRGPSGARPLDAIDEVVTRACVAVEDGGALVKVKVTPESADLDAVDAVAAALPEGMVAVDFNGTATAEALDRLSGLGLAYVEQPAPADALVRSAELARRIDAPIALDESLRSVALVEAAAALGAGSVANVKPARCGGPFEAVAMAVRAADVGMSVFVGGMLETGIGRAAALAVAAHPVCTLPTDLGPSSAYFEEDLTEPIGCDSAGRVLVPDGPGLGRSPDPARLEAATLGHLRLSS